MSRQIQLLLYGGIVAAVVIVLLVVFWPVRPPEAPSVPGGGNKPEISATKLNLSGSSADGKLEWQAACDRIEGGLEQPRVTASGIELSLREAGKQVLFVRAPELAFDRETRHLTLTGKFVAWSQTRGLRFEADRLVFDFSADTLTAEGGITASRKGAKLTASKLESDLRLSKLRLSGSPKVIW